ncbi:hypothetical protein BKA58DRAFT_74432 [Alternaria rosae]|uniref:uncharacterized protein n=1 Tax=Alternaria rosae TaxID=1187941 RepID=UPI001E8D669C|nr:uncharacterized protein BKA58DRAFT_74432 [Alternaria rosae]KAH6877449.1 hypothetical protein BKA58DRAFT_74432 [Alternaria rosae]
MTAVRNSLDTQISGGLGCHLKSGCHHHHNTMPPIHRAYCSRKYTAEDNRRLRDLLPRLYFTIASQLYLSTSRQIGSRPSSIYILLLACYSIFPSPTLSSYFLYHTPQPPLRTGLSLLFLPWLAASLCFPSEPSPSPTTTTTHRPVATADPAYESARSAH